MSIIRNLEKIDDLDRHFEHPFELYKDTKMEIIKIEMHDLDVKIWDELEN